MSQRLLLESVSAPLPSSPITHAHAHGAMPPRDYHTPLQIVWRLSHHGSGAGAGAGVLLARSQSLSINSFPTLTFAQLLACRSPPSDGVS